MSRKIQNAIVASAIALVASVGAAEAATTVKFWHSFNESNGETLDKIVAGFEAANPDIDIEAAYVCNYNNIVAKLQAAIPARSAPETVILQVYLYGRFARKTLLPDMHHHFAIYKERRVGKERL